MYALCKKLTTKIWLCAMMILVISAAVVYKPLAAPTNGNYYAVGYDYPTGTYHYCALRVYADFKNGAITTITNYSYVTDLMYFSGTKPSIISSKSVRGSYSGVGSSMITYSGRVTVNFQ